MWRAQLLVAAAVAAVAATGITSAQPTASASSGAPPLVGGSSQASYGGSQAAVGSTEMDVQSLLQLRDAVENWPEFSAANGYQGWNESTPPCAWTGVTCSDDGTILTLSLQCRACAVRAVGTLPAQLGTMRTLATLDLQSNSFYGTLPQLWGDVDTWPALQNLYLNDNNLTGSLPQNWGDSGSLPSLLQLRADSNRLTGTLPQQWGSQETSMRELGVLRLSKNSLTGTLPDQWGTPGAFPQLSVLALDANRLTGTLPDIWGAAAAMAYLQELYVQNNSMSGGLPDSWGGSGGMPSLRFFFAANNPLGGTLPATWGQNGSFPELKTLDLNTSSLYGTLPPQWASNGAMPTLDAIRLQNNDLSGSIPAEWANFQSLSRITLKPGNARMCGPIPVLRCLLCDERDLTCLRLPVTFNQTCGPLLALAPAPAPEAEQLPMAGAAAPGSAAGAFTVQEQPVASQSLAAQSQPTSSSGGSGDPDSSDSGGGGSSMGAIVGGVVGGVAAIALAAAIAALVAARRRRRRRQDEEQRAAQKTPSVRPFIAEEEELERGGTCNGSGGANGITSPFAAANSPLPPAYSAPTSVAAASSTRTPPNAERRSSRFSSLLPSSSGSLLLGWCSDGRTASRTNSLELMSPPADDPELQGNGGMKVMAQIMEEGEGGSAGTRRLATVADEQLPSSPLGSGSSPETGSPMAGSRPISRFLSASVPWSDWEVKPEEIEIAKRPDGSDWLLGSGGFGKVYKALRHGVQPVAVKIIPVIGDMQNATSLAEARQEIAILRACRDVNIVQFVGASLTTEQSMLVTEYMEGGSLLHNIAAGRVSWYRRGRKIALDVARGLVFLHSRRVVHFDLKSPNILLARDGTAKIGDVGMAKIMNRDYVTGVVSTLAWSAPEMLWGTKCTEKADIYSYGIVLWEICTGQAPERGRLRDVRVPDECPAEVRQLILECLDSHPSLRPTALQIVERLAALPAAVGPAPPAQQQQQAAQSPEAPWTPGTSCSGREAAAARAAC